MYITDEDALICDFAETYHILGWKSLPVSLAATLAAGLRDNSRSKLALIGRSVPLEMQLAAGTYDKLAYLAWSKTKDAQKGRGCPPSVLAELMGQKNNKNENKPVGFDSAESFERTRQKLIGKVIENGT